nr:DUF5085 family protein [Enterococcus lactis]
MRKTIGYKQALHYQNVISRYYVTNTEELGGCLEDVLETIFEADYSLSDSFFYSMNSDIREEEVLVQVFLPVNEEWRDDLSEEYRFHSYFQVNNILATRAKGEMLSEFSKALEELIAVIVQEDLTVVSPIFYRPKVINELVYTDLMVGIK